jgi:hypothetical protein
VRQNKKLVEWYNNYCVFVFDMLFLCMCNFFMNYRTMGILTKGGADTGNCWTKFCLVETSYVSELIVPFRCMLLLILYVSELSVPFRCMLLLVCFWTLSHSSACYCSYCMFLNSVSHSAACYCTYCISTG